MRGSEHSDTNPFDDYRALNPCSELASSLQWFGGTYAAHPQFFPREQSQPEWIARKMLPIKIMPPRRFVHFCQTQWQRRFPWWGTGDPGRIAHPHEFTHALEDPVNHLLRPDLASPLSLEQIRESWSAKFEWFGGVPAECGEHTAKPTWAARHCVPCLKVTSDGPPTSPPQYSDVHASAALAPPQQCLQQPRLRPNF